MQEQALLLRELRPPGGAEPEPQPGFYARVMERIEAEGPISIWNLFVESAFGRRIAVASMALALLLGVYLVSVERSMDEPITASEQSEPADRQNLTVAGEDAPGRVITLMGQSDQFAADQSAAGQSADDAVLANLVTYQEQ
jgi:hypothetical protein